MDFSRALFDVQQVVNKQLRVFFDRKQTEVKQVDVHLMPLVDQIIDLTMRGGKKTRPFLVWVGYLVGAHQPLTVYNSQPTTHNLQQPLISAMLAVELFQTFALVHDDIMDQDTQRRGGVTVHEYFRLPSTVYHLPQSKAQHFGESMAILAGDLAFAWATECIQSTSNGGAIEFFNIMSQQTIYGQTLDILQDQGGETIDMSHIIKYKTAYYSAVRPLQIGASLFTPSQKELGILEIYGLAVGHAFQLRDDNLDGQLSDEEFHRRVQKYKKSADEAIDQLNRDKEVAGLLKDIVQFVIERTA